MHRDAQLGDRRGRLGALAELGGELRGCLPRLAGPFAECPGDLHGCLHLGERRRPGGHDVGHREDRGLLVRLDRDYLRIIVRRHGEALRQQRGDGRVRLVGGILERAAILDDERRLGDGQVVRLGKLGQRRAFAQLAVKIVHEGAEQLLLLGGAHFRDQLGLGLLQRLAGDFAHFVHAQHGPTERRAQRPDHAALGRGEGCLGDVGIGLAGELALVHAIDARRGKAEAPRHVIERLPCLRLGGGVLRGGLGRQDELAHVARLARLIGRGLALVGRGKLSVGRRGGRLEAGEIDRRIAQAALLGHRELGGVGAVIGLQLRVARRRLGREGGGRDGEQLARALFEQHRGIRRHHALGRARAGTHGAQHLLLEDLALDVLAELLLVDAALGKELAEDCLAEIACRIHERRVPRDLRVDQRLADPHPVLVAISDERLGGDQLVSDAAQPAFGEELVHRQLGPLLAHALEHELRARLEFAHRERLVAHARHLAVRRAEHVEAARSGHVADDEGEGDHAQKRRGDETADLGAEHAAEEIHGSASRSYRAKCVAHALGSVPLFRNGPWARVRDWTNCFMPSIGFPLNS